MLIEAGIKPAIDVGAEAESVPSKASKGKAITYEKGMSPSRMRQVSYCWSFLQ